MAAAGTPDQAGHTAPAALMPGFQRVERRVLQAAVDDVDRLQPVQRPQPQPTFAHDEISAFDKVVPETRGEVAVLDVGGVRRPGGEHHCARAGAIGRR